MRIILTNWITERIFLQGGARQGFTLSPLIHVLRIEVLANLIRDSPNILFFCLVQVAFSQG